MKGDKLMQRVAIGLSGGVDSSTAAALLKEENYEVVGITFKFTEDFDATDAIKVAEKLEIEHHLLDYQKEFKEQVIDKFIADYRRGITPNPCIMCNKEVKLNFLYQEMLKLNCDFIATGHYAKIESGHLFKSKDEFKDQTYFLCEVPKEILNHLILPLEGIEKSKVRELAASFDLEVASKKDSTDVCFITKTFREFISNKISSTSGDIIDIGTKKVIGKHQGLSNYTIGQRKGLNIGGAADRVFVAGKDLENNILYVTIGDEEKLISDSCIIENVNWLATKKVTSCLAKFRYHAKDVKVTLEWLDNNEILVKYPEGFRAVTPGQACVFYLDTECLGGGIIKTVKKNEEELWYI